MARPQEAILDTYQTERHPVAGLNCEQSTTNAFKMITLVEALGLTSSPTTERMLDTIADPAQSERIATAVADQATHFDMIGLQLGYVYADGALAGDGDPPPPLEDPSWFEPDGAIGARLPHAWTGDGRSTLDLVEADGLTLISFGANRAWSEALAAITIPVAHVAIGGSVQVDDRWRRLCRLEEDGALLVRPDHHIAWRAGSAEPRTVADLVSAVDRIVGR